MEKHMQYTGLILDKLGEIFEENEMLMQELSEGTNATEFIHALANMVPTHFYNELTSNSLQILEFNHLANRLVFQNANSITKE
ncbi:MAG: hypothetical protein ACI9N9_000023 [Enterobacterales bacterium]|jgi:hypothetical protein